MKGNARKLDYVDEKENETVNRLLREDGMKNELG